MPLGFNIAWRLASWPTRRSPWSVKATTEGVVRAPSALGITIGFPPSVAAMTELVVPRSMPTATAITTSYCGSAGRAFPALGLPDQPRQASAGAATADGGTAGQRHAYATGHDARGLRRLRHRLIDLDRGSCTFTASVAYPGRLSLNPVSAGMPASPAERGRPGRAPADQPDDAAAALAPGRPRTSRSSGS